MASPTFTDEETARILERAAELSGAPASRGTTLEELERIAVEAGLDPAAVRRAALEVRGNPAPSRWRTIFGPMSVRLETEVEGELDDVGRERVAEALHKAIGGAGSLDSVGRVLTYTIQGARNGRNLTVVVSSRDGRTHITFEERLGAIAGGIYGGVGGGSSSLVIWAAIGAGTVLGPAAAVGAGVLAAASLFGLTRTLYGFAAGRRRRSAEKAFEEVRIAVESATQARKAELAGGTLEEARARVLSANAVERVESVVAQVEAEHATMRRR